MKLVVDTNILLSALIKNSTTRSILLNPNHIFYLPEFAIDEAQKYFELISSKSGLPVKEIKLILDLLATNFEVVSLKDFAQCFREAEKVMKSVDEKDALFVALALCIKCDGIWSNDRDLKEQHLVKVWNTAEIVKGRV